MNIAMRCIPANRKAIEMERDAWSLSNKIRRDERPSLDFSNYLCPSPLNLRLEYIESSCNCYCYFCSLLSVCFPAPATCVFPNNWNCDSFTSSIKITMQTPFTPCLNQSRWPDLDRIFTHLPSALEFWCSGINGVKLPTPYLSSERGVSHGLCPCRLPPVARPRNCGGSWWSRRLTGWGRPPPRPPSGHWCGRWRAPTRRQCSCRRCPRCWCLRHTTCRPGREEGEIC